MKPRRLRNLSNDRRKLGPLEDLFYGNASARLLDFFNIKKEHDLSETDIAKQAGVSIRTTFREIPKFEQLGLIKFTRRVGRAKMYQLDPYSDVSKSLQQLVDNISAKRNDYAIQNNDQEQKKFVKQGEKIVVKSNLT